MDGFAQDTDLVRRLVEYVGTTPAMVAKKAGVAVTTINRPLNGTSPSRLGRAALEKLQAAYPDFPGWLQPTVSESRQPFRGAGRERDDALVDVPYIDLYFGLGAAIMDVEIREDNVPTDKFPRWFIRQITDVPPEMLCWGRVRGDSMETTLRDGDAILINRSPKSIFMSDEIWVFAYGNAGMVKRLRPMPDGSVTIMSDNPSVRDETAYDGELHLFGIVECVLSKPRSYGLRGER